VLNDKTLDAVSALRVGRRYSRYRQQHRRAQAMQQAQEGIEELNLKGSA